MRHEYMTPQSISSNHFFSSRKRLTSFSNSGFPIEVLPWEYAFDHDGMPAFQHRKCHGSRNKPKRRLQVLKIRMKELQYGDVASTYSISENTIPKLGRGNLTIGPVDVQQRSHCK